MRVLRDVQLRRSRVERGEAVGEHVADRRRPAARAPSSSRQAGHRAARRRGTARCGAKYDRSVRRRSGRCRGRRRRAARRCRSRRSCARRPRHRSGPSGACAATPKRGAGVDQRRARARARSGARRARRRAGGRSDSATSCPGPWNVTPPPRPTRKHRHAEALRRAAQIGGVGAAAERVDRRMLEQQQLVAGRAAATRRRRSASCSASASAYGTSRADARAGARGDACERRARPRGRCERGGSRIALTPAAASPDSRGCPSAPRESGRPRRRSSTRWSHDSVARIVLATASWPSRTIGRSFTAPTARIAACGGLITATSSSTSSMPTFERLNVPPDRSSPPKRPWRAFSVSAAARGGDLAKRQRLGAVQHRHDQAVVDRDGDADVDVVVQLDGAVAPRRVDARMAHQRDRQRAHQQMRDGEARASPRAA